jgi:hypothetical protein
MAIDTQAESLLSLTEATKALPRVNGKRPSISTLWRWCRRGLRGVRLEYVRVGRGIATSRDALNRFFNALAAADPTVIPPGIPEHPPTVGANAKARQRQLSDADRVLDRAGI